MGGAMGGRFDDRWNSPSGVRIAEKFGSTLPGGHLWQIPGPICGTWPENSNWSAKGGGSWNGFTL